MDPRYGRDRNDFRQFEGSDRERARRQSEEFSRWGNPGSRPDPNWGREDGFRADMSERDFGDRESYSRNRGPGELGTAGRSGTYDASGSQHGMDFESQRRDRFPSGGAYAGRGPKGYQRSDERIKEDACDCLTRDPHVDASEIEIEVRNCEVTLKGTVTDRNQKRRAEDLIEDVLGVKGVHNQIRVQSSQGETFRQDQFQQNRM